MTESDGEEWKENGRRARFRLSTEAYDDFLLTRSYQDMESFLLKKGVTPFRYKRALGVVHCIAWYQAFDHGSELDEEEMWTRLRTQNVYSSIIMDLRVIPEEQAVKFIREAYRIGWAAGNKHRITS